MNKFFKILTQRTYTDREKAETQERLSFILKDLKSLEKKGKSLTYRNRVDSYDIYLQGLLKYSLTQKEFDYIDHFILEDVLKEIK